MHDVKQQRYDLEQRTFSFAQRVNQYIADLPRTVTNIEIGKQLTRSASSVGANYIEANEALGKKDFIMRVKISKKEAKETTYWLRLSIPNLEHQTEQTALIDESIQLMKIFATIISNVVGKAL